MKIDDEDVTVLVLHGDVAAVQPAVRLDLGAANSTAMPCETAP